MLSVLHHLSHALLSHNFSKFPILKLSNMAPGSARCHLIWILMSWSFYTGQSVLWLFTCCFSWDPKSCWSCSSLGIGGWVLVKYFFPLPLIYMRLFASMTLTFHAWDPTLVKRMMRSGKAYGAAIAFPRDFPPMTLYRNCYTSYRDVSTEVLALLHWH